MVFAPSSAPDITEGLPFDLGRLARSSVLTEAPSNTDGLDVSFGALGFRLRPSDSAPYQRGTEPNRKQQIDTSKNPGEQSLGNWWSRAMSTWDSGAGVKFYDAGTDDTASGRFYVSQGVDVWEPGEVSLLHAMAAAPGSLPAGGHGYVAQYSTSQFVEWRGETCRRFDATSVVHTATTGTTGTTMSRPITVGNYSYAASLSGVWKYDPSSSTLTKPITYTATNARVFYSKARLFIAVDNVLYTAALTASGAIGTVGTALYTHADTAWVWTGVAEAAGAVLASGYSGGTSAIFRFALDVDGSNNPILVQSGIVQEMPTGEAIRAMASYLGTSLVLGTSKGARVGQMNSAGDIQLGPLTIETTAAVTDIAFRDRFAFVSYTASHLDGRSGAARLDLSLPIGDTGRVAWAADVSLPGVDASVVEGVTMLAERAVVSTAAGLYIESATVYEAQGVLDTGRIRFGTTEPKAFCFLRVIAATNHGKVLLSATDADGVESGLVSMDDAFSTASDLPIVTSAGRPVEQYLSFRVYLNRSANTLSTPVLTALTVKAQPAAARIRLFQYPLSIFRNETDRLGARHHEEPYPRLLALEALEESAVPITVRDYRTGETYIGQIDSVNFTGPYAADRGDDGYGGVAVVVVRRLG